MANREYKVKIGADISDLESGFDRAAAKGKGLERSLRESAGNYRFDPKMGDPSQAVAAWVSRASAALAQAAQALQQQSINPGTFKFDASALRGVAQQGQQIAQGMRAMGDAAQQAGQRSSGAMGAMAGDAARAAAAVSGTRDSIGGLNMSLGELVRASAVFSLVQQGLRGIASAASALPRTGILSIAETETAQLGMAGILASMTEINGKAISFNQAQQISAGVVDRMRIAAAATAASTGELVETYRSLLGPAMAAGMSMKQIEQFAITGTNAVKSMGLPIDQVVQELKSIVSGNIGADSSVASALGITSDDISKARASAGGLFEFLNGRMQGFASSADQYSKTLQGSFESLQEQITQQAAKSMAPVADAAKRAMQQIGDALKSDGAQSAMDGIGQGMASTITALSDGVAAAREYKDAIELVAVALVGLKLGGMVAELARLTAAKMDGINASRASAVQSALEGNANIAQAQASRQVVAGLLAEQRARVEALAAKAQYTAASLAEAEAHALSLSGMRRVGEYERTVIPLRQQHAAATSALEQAQGRLTSAINAGSGATRAMGAVIGALGGPVGIAIAAVTALVGGIISMRKEAEDTAKLSLSTERVEAALASGGKVDSADSGRVQAALAKAKEDRDAALIAARKARDELANSPVDFSGGEFGDNRIAEQAAAKLDAALKAAEERVQKLQKLAEGIDGAGSTAAAGTAARATSVGQGGGKGDRERFIQAAAKELGLDDRFIRAQIVLEAGRGEPKTVGDYNYGNIKAGKSWQGNTKSINALEYDASGKAYNEPSKFRSYQSPEEAGADYAKLLAGSKRYQGALGAKDITEFATKLKEGGYATDKDYVSKMVGVFNSLEKSKVRTGTEKGRGTTAPVDAGQLNLNAGASSKALDEILKDAKSPGQIAKEGAEALQKLDQAYKQERELRVKRGADNKELLQLDRDVAYAREQIEKDTHDKVKAAQEKGLGEQQQRAAAQAALAQSTFKAGYDARIAALDEAEAGLQQRRDLGLLRESEYVTQSTELQRQRLAERVKLIDAEIAANAKIRPKDDIEKTNLQAKQVSLASERKLAQDQIRRAVADGANKAGLVDIQESRQQAERNVQVWQQAQQQIEQLRQSNAANASQLLRDPLEQAKVDTALQIKALEKARDEMATAIRSQAVGNTDAGQRKLLMDQIEAINTETSRAIELQSQGLAEKLKPGWQAMVDGWRDANKLMRETTDQTMQGLVSGTENAFVKLVTERKLDLKSLADDFLAQQARMQFRKLASTDEGGGVLKAVAGWISGKPGAANDGTAEAAKKAADALGGTASAASDAAKATGTVGAAMSAAQTASAAATAATTTSTTADQTAASALTELTAAAQMAAQALQQMAGKSASGGDAVGGFAGIIGKMFGGADSAANAGDYGGIDYSSMIVPSAAGGWDIPAGQNPLTQLHEREMVLPAQHADTIRRLGQGGGVQGGGASGVTVNIITQPGTEASQTQRTGPGGEQIIDVIVRRVKGEIADDISNGGPVQDAVGGRFGLTRSRGATKYG